MTPLLRFLFSNGWGFLLPYFIVYLVAGYSGQTVAQTSLFFQLLHVFSFGLLVRFLLQIQIKNLNRADIFFAFALALFSLLPGAYLEYPSDPIEHVRRIFHWQPDTILSEDFYFKKFAYFWGWTLLSWIPMDLRWVALSCYGAFWQLLWLFQFFLLFRAMGLQRSGCYFLVFVAFSFWGTNLFGMRYYTLSSTPLAQILYLQGLTIFVCFLRKKKSKANLILIPILGIFIHFNHFQEQAYLALGILLVTLAYLLEKCSTAQTKTFLKTGVLLYAILLLMGPILYQLKPDLFMIAPSSINRLKGYRIFDSTSSIFQTLGIPGYAGLLCAVFYLKKFPYLTLLTLGPAAFLYAGPTAAWFSRFAPSDYEAYRIFYLFPPSLMLFWTLYHLARTRFRSKALSWIAPLTLVFVIGAIPMSPVRGRLFFQLFPTPNHGPRDHYAGVSNWVRNQGFENCTLITDAMSRFYLTAQLGWKLGETERLNPVLLTQEKSPSLMRLEAQAKQTSVCGILVPKNIQNLASPPSLFGRLSGHWDASLSNLGWYYSHEFLLFVNRLDSQGWERIEVTDDFVFFNTPKVQ